MSARQDHYEFSPDDNRLFTDLSQKMRAVGSLTALIGTIAAVFAGFQISSSRLSAAPLAALLAGAFLAATGVWSLQAGKAFQLVAATQGHDISHVMAALRSLHRLYRLHYSLGIGFLALMAFLVVFGLLASPAH